MSYRGAAVEDEDLEVVQCPDVGEARDSEGGAALEGERGEVLEPVGHQGPIKSASGTHARRTPAPRARACTPRAVCAWVGMGLEEPKKAPPFRNYVFFGVVALAV